MHEHKHGEQWFGAEAQAAEWDTRYSEREGARWSGRPNGRLVAEVANLTRAGRSTSAVARARTLSGSLAAAGRSRDRHLRRRPVPGGEEAELAGATVEWLCGDALQTPFPARTFDLVSMQYPALPKAAGDSAVRELLGTVRPGGLLLAVYHDLDDEHCEHMKSKGLDPADYVAADDLSRLVGDDFTVEWHAVEPRIDPPPDTPHVADVVLRARRR